MRALPPVAVRLVWLVLVAGVLAACAAHAAPRPVVLVPGLLGHRKVGAIGRYFIGTERALERAGYDVTVLTPPPMATSRERGAYVKRAIEQVVARAHADAAVVVTHSQGGVDVRYALAAGAPIAAVATIAAPHHGTPVAQNALRWPHFLVGGVLDAMHRLWQREQRVDETPSDVIADLRSLLPSDDAAAIAPTDAGVPVFSVAGTTGGDVDGACEGGRWSAPVVDDRPHPGLVFGLSMIAYERGRVSSDGIVPTSSMRYGRFLGCAPADHWDWLGYMRPFPAAAGGEVFDVLGFEVELVDALQDVARRGEGAMDDHVDALAGLARARPVPSTTRSTTRVARATLPP